MRIAAIVVTYNRKEMLRENLDALLGQVYSTFDILIVDNASDDGTAETIASYLKNPRIHYANTGENLGGAGGFQCGMLMAFKRGYDRVWLMDDDCLPYPDALEKLVQADQCLGDAYGFLSSVVLWTDGAPCTMNIQAVSMRKKIQFDDSASIQGLVTVQYATFVSFFVPKHVVEAVGLPIKEFFIWADDWEYARRISRNYPCYVMGDSIVTHACIHNAGSNIVVDDPSRFWRYCYAYRNEVYVYRREGLKGWLWLLAKNGLHSVRVLCRGKNRRGERLGIIWKGFMRGCGFCPGVKYLTEEIM
ncbi:glycosyltransferase family 2 protein [Eubacteriales bacterium OttesenSCG-928-A19]|nr:glycosyltransferase family 2 protein [Eubacteriales bacterium OttesenSCG-928-A19]